ncbi:SCO family protein [Marinobacter sp.]|uniref:SCO family protein n=1 Tax=Marinobacter sp. TaxID=50741 RepID=UPI0038513620
MTYRGFTRHLKKQLNRRILFLVLTAAIISGCTSGEQEWNGKNITGVMPDLEFELVNSNNDRVTAADYSGQVRLLFFGFTSCPDVCPTALSHIQKSIRQMPEELQKKVTVLFVSVDPERDTPELIGEYASFFGDNITGLTAEESTLRQLAKRYRTTFGYSEPDSNGHYQVSHSSAIYVFDTQGRIRLLLRPELPTELIAEDLADLVKAGI